MPSAVGKLRLFKTTVPVPEADSSRSALEVLVDMLLSDIVTASTAKDPVSVLVPPNVGVFMTGEVNVLLDRACDPVSVTTVLSMVNVTVLPDPAVSIPVPPVKVKVSESRSIDNAPPESAWKSRSCAVTCEST